MSTTRPARTRSGWVGWIVFAAAMMLVIGVFNAITGLVAIFSDDVYVGTVGDQAILFDATGWGWVHLLFGIILVLVGLGLIQGALWASVTAVILVMLNMISQLMLLPAYPLWSLLIIAVDILILWALLVHGDEPL